MGVGNRDDILFCCNCVRCTDPAELNTHFSSVRCQVKNCCGLVLPTNPCDTQSGWKCNKCKHSSTYEQLVHPILALVESESGMGVGDALFSEYEFYSCDEPDKVLVGPEVVEMKLNHVKQVMETVEDIQGRLVHPNHFSLLPTKTAVLATINALLFQLNEEQASHFIPQFLQLTREVIQVMDVIQPGLTRERGIMLLFLCRGLQVVLKRFSGTFMEAENAWIQAESILSLESQSDTFRLLLQTSRPNSTDKLLLEPDGTQDVKLKGQ